MRDSGMHFGHGGSHGFWGHGFWGDGRQGFGLGRERRGEGLGHLFAHGNLHLVVLHLIAEKPRHGYEIIKVIEEMVGGAYTPSPGAIYPALSMLDDEGYVTIAAGEGNKKLYSITPDGRAYLEQNKDELSLMLDRMKKAGETLGGEPPFPIIRAGKNLMMALYMRLMRKPLEKEQIQTIVEALDRASQEIERS